ncbi:MAG: MBL fold metallo-hydrolase [Spirochaetales bacterium]|jgi:ribonuclease BN (tRNA processing enzyme)|nr:MBL fold metallo-hydrolase [Spirochaetales bacterium]
MRIEPLANGEKLSLSYEDEELRLFFIGTGSAFSKILNQTNLLIIKGKDHLLVDCGTKTPQALHSIGCPLSNIRNYFLTHTHADHIGGVEEVCLTSRYMKKKKPAICIPEYFENILWDYSLAGGAAYNERTGGKPLTFGDFWEIKRPVWAAGYPRETWEADIGSINLKIFRTMHIPDSASTWEDSFPSFGLVIDNIILFSSDTRFDPDMVRDYGSNKKIQAIFHDCQFFTGGVHSSLEELSTLPKDIRAKTYLMHYQDSWEKVLPAVEEAGFAGFARQHVYYIFP